MRLSVVVPVLVIVSWCGLRATPAKAAPAAPTVESARMHFQKGVSLYRERNFDAALAEFERAYDIAPEYHLLYNLGQVQLERHDYLAAAERFRMYLKEGAADIKPEKRVEVEDELRTLSGLVAEISVETNIEGSELAIDGVRVLTLPMTHPLPVNAGIHALQVRKPGYMPTSRTLTIVGGESQRLLLTLTSDAAVAPLVSKQESPPERVETRNRMPMWISLVAVVGLGTAAITMSLEAAKTKTSFEGDLAAFPGNVKRIDQDRSRLRLYAGLADGFGAAALVAAGFLAYTGLRNDSAKMEKPVARAEHLRIEVDWATLRLAGDF